MYVELDFSYKTQGWRMLPEDFYLHKDNSQLVFHWMHQPNHKCGAVSSIGSATDVAPLTDYGGDASILAVVLRPPGICSKMTIISGVLVFA